MSNSASPGRAADGDQSRTSEANQDTPTTVETPAVAGTHLDPAPESNGSTVSSVTVEELGRDAVRTDRRVREFDPRVLDSVVRDLTRDTHGTIVYQEQIMHLLRRLGYTWTDADKWVKSLKDNVKTLALAVDEVKGKPVYRAFVQTLVTEYGASEEDAWAYVDRFTQYVFNKAHSVGYALTAYLQMWLKVHYPLEFWCATIQAETFERRRHAYMVAASRSGIVFLTPHVNGTGGFSIETNAIRVGTVSLKGVGEKASAAIESGRPYSDKDDLLARVARRSANSRVLAILEDAGALDFTREGQIARAVALNQGLRESGLDLRVYQGGFSHG